MADSNTNLPTGAPPLILAILMVAAGFIVHQFQLESARPAGSEAPLSNPPPLQITPARLWQDPLTAAGPGSDRSRPAGALLESKPFGDLRSLIDLYVAPYAANRRSTLHINVIGVMVFGGPYSEYAELRRRARYAIVTGLLESDYVPYDAEKLGVIRHKLASNAMLDIPFEFYVCSPSDLDPPSNGCRSGSHALVLWLNDDEFSNSPLVELNHLFFAVDRPDTRYALTKSLIGPAGSGTLIQMVRQAVQKQPDTTSLSKLRVYSPAATVPARNLLQDAVGDKEAASALEKKLSSGSAQSLLVNAFKKRGIFFVSTIGTDDLLTQLLVEEVTLRAFSARCFFERSDADPMLCGKPAEILVIGEGDTAYGRALTSSFIARLKDYQCAVKQKACRDRVDDQIFSLKYLRGLDGETSRLRKDQTEKETKPSDSKERSTESASGSPTTKELGAGNAQYDYLRRLSVAAKLVEKQSQTGGPAVFRAIGIFGSDPYDKLVIMQALRPQFPNAYFFTTDVDVRYLQKDQFPWARNLLIASHYGLELNWQVHKDFGPFRDSYQSSQFLAARLASSCDELAMAQLAARDLLAYPRLYELTSKGFAELETKANPPERRGGWLGRLVEASYPIRQLSRDAADPAHPPTAANPNAGRQCGVFFPSAAGKAIDTLHQKDPALLSKLKRTDAIFVALVVACLVSLCSYRVRKALGMMGRTVGLYFVELTIGIAIAAVLSWFDIPGYSVAAISLCSVAFYWALSYRLRRSSTGARFGIVILSALIFLLLRLAFLAATGEPEEPWGFANGASSWLSFVLRFAAALFNVAAIIFTFRALRDNTAEIERRYFPKEQPRLRWGRKITLADVLAGSWAEDKFFRGSGLAKELDPVELWVSYQRLLRPKRLAIRASIGTIGVCLIFGLLFAIDPLVQPVRGVWSTILDTALFLFSATTLFWFLFLVIDVVKSTTRFVGFQSQGETLWPDHVLPRIELSDGSIVDRVRRDRIDLELLSKRTETISRVVVIPFIPLLLMLAARNSLLDAWPWTWLIVLFFGFGFLLLIMLAIHLRNVADGGRQAVRKRLTDATTSAAEANNTAAVSYFGAVSKSLEQISTGAYSPLLHAEWLRGITIPTTGYGAIELLRSFLQ